MKIVVIGGTGLIGSKGRGLPRRGGVRGGARLARHGRRTRGDSPRTARGGYLVRDAWQTLGRDRNSGPRQPREVTQ